MIGSGMPMSQRRPPFNIAVSRCLRAGTTNWAVTGSVLSSFMPTHHEMWRRECLMALMLVMLALAAVAALAIGVLIFTWTGSYFLVGC